ncbi:MAG: flavodoxin domain-containing protein [Candidatus Roizmanbacteria bacterium]
MRIHIIFATYSSATQSTAEYIASISVARGHTCKLILVGDVHATDLSEADFLIFGSPSWERDNFKYNGQPHFDFFPFFKKYGYDLDSASKSSTLDLHQAPCAVFGLGDKNYPVFCGAVDILADFLSLSHGQVMPNRLRIDEYYFHTSSAQESIRIWLDEVLVSPK